jgi:outer membrane protein TolC
LLVTSLPIAFAQNQSEQLNTNVGPPGEPPGKVGILPQPLLPSPGNPPEDRYPIDLATALQLAGAGNLQIALARERIREAQARLEGARALWLPSVNVGVGYNKHDGRIQDTRGEVIEVSRNSLFVGGGPSVGTFGASGASTQPRLVTGISLADALFAPLAERQTVRATQAAAATRFNDTLLLVALAYTDLAGTQSQVAIAHEAVRNAEELVRLVGDRVKAGTAPPADGLRAQAELSERRRQLALTEERVRVASTELVRLLRLDAAVTLFPLENQPVPVVLVPEDAPLTELIAQGIANRPEIEANRALVEATLQRLRQERWRPWLPSLQVGVSAGGFGGGEGSFLGDYSDRVDFDALVVWELRNLGFGNRALRRERDSQNAQANLAVEEIREIVAAEVAQAYHQVKHRREQIDAARGEVTAAAEAVPLNFKGIQGNVLRAIEAQQAIQALAAARFLYLDAVLDHNRAQFQLLRALGQLPSQGKCDE